MPLGNTNGFIDRISLFPLIDRNASKRSADLDIGVTLVMTSSITSSRLAARYKMRGPVESTLFEHIDLCSLQAMVCDGLASWFSRKHTARNKRVRCWDQGVERTLSFEDAGQTIHLWESGVD